MLEEFNRHNAQLSAVGVQYNVQVAETAIQYSELLSKRICQCADSSAK